MKRNEIMNQANQASRCGANPIFFDLARCSRTDPRPHGPTAYFHGLAVGGPVWRGGHGSRTFSEGFRTLIISFWIPHFGKVLLTHRPHTAHTPPTHRPRTAQGTHGITGPPFRFRLHHYEHYEHSSGLLDRLREETEQAEPETQ